MKIYLIRHAHFKKDEDVNRANVDDYLIEIDGSITDLGKTQVSRLVQRFVSEGINYDSVYASRLKRGTESAELFEESYTKLTNRNHRLTFLEDLVEGKSGEKPEDVVKRMRRVIDLIKSSGVDSALVFSHSHSIRDLLNSIVDDKFRTILPHTGVALLDYSRSTPKIIDYNPSSHITTDIFTN